VEQHLQDYPDCCILNLCRLIYSFATRDVVISKATAWADANLPAWRRYIILPAESAAHSHYPGNNLGAKKKDERKFLIFFREYV
jgi:hypothetical protein